MSLIVLAPAVSAVDSAAVDSVAVDVDAVASVEAVLELAAEEPPESALDEGPFWPQPASAKESKEETSKTLVFMGDGKRGGIAGTCKSEATIAPRDDTMVTAGAEARGGGPGGAKSVRARGGTTISGLIGANNFCAYLFTSKNAANMA